MGWEAFLPPPPPSVFSCTELWPCARPTSQRRKLCLPHPVWNPRPKWARPPEQSRLLGQWPSPHCGVSVSWKPQRSGPVPRHTRALPNSHQAAPVAPWVLPGSVSLVSRACGLPGKRPLPAVQPVRVMYHWETGRVPAVLQHCHILVGCRNLTSNLQGRVKAPVFPGICPSRFQWSQSGVGLWDRAQKESSGQL